ncbi:MAG TPA: type II toxin-antitoxin system VapC family toxin [Caulobacteraceae bacterium]|jgi:ribonuclease VapC
MVIDTSVIIAILLDEPDAAEFAAAIEQDPLRLLSAANLLEASIVIETRKGDEGARDLDLLIYRAGIQVVPVDAEQAEVARLAWRRYGKGRHPASLNYGACFAYALAKTSGSRLLFKGADFSQSDLA